MDMEMDAILNIPFHVRLRPNDLYGFSLDTTSVESISNTVGLLNGIGMMIVTVK